MYTKNNVLIKLENDLERRGYSNQSKKRYEYIVNSFIDYINSIGINKNIDDYDEYDVIKYLEFLKKKRNYKNSSYNNVNSILKFFLEVTLEKDIGYRRLPNRKVEIRKKARPDRNTILKIINGTNNLKHKCWYSLAYGSGLRVSEIARLKVKNVDSINMKITVIGKGNKERITVLPKITLEILKKYVKESNITKKEEYLFKGQNKREFIHEGSISRSLSDIVKKLNLNKDITMHSLRRSFATHLLRDNNINIEIVKELMGHNSITTTSGYIEYVYKELKIKNPLDMDF